MTEENIEPAEDAKYLQVALAYFVIILTYEPSMTFSEVSREIQNIISEQQHIVAIISKCVTGEDDPQIQISLTFNPTKTLLVVARNTVRSFLYNLTAAAYKKNVYASEIPCLALT